MKFIPYVFSALAACSFVAGASTALAAAVAAPTEAQTHFFEEKVRPILVDRCYKCHSETAKKVKGGLLLDTRHGWEKGGDSGPSIEPGNLEDSIFIQAIRYLDKDLQMPPKDQLPKEEIAVLEQWVTMGAPDPRTEKSKVVKADPAKMKDLWSFKPIQNPPLPAVSNEAWPKSDFDRFILAGLDAAELAPSAPADRRVLIRRAYFDIIGLPPTYAEVEAFAADPAPDAWPKLVDALLARPEYGERWARHWLDIARYADTREQSVDGERRFPFAYTFRDFVINSFNADKPFNRFIEEQIAADLMPDADKTALAGLGFLTVGRKFLGNNEAPHLVVDDQIDVVTRGFMGLTVSCARCHDHKFDPIPTADYYSLYGVFASSEEPLDLPEIARHGSEQEIAAHLAERQKKFDEYEQHLQKCMDGTNKQLRELAPEYLHYLAESLPNHRTVEGFIPLDTPKGYLVPGGPDRWQKLIDTNSKDDHAFFNLWLQLAALKRENFAQTSHDLVEKLAAEPGRVHPWLIEGLRATPPATMDDVAKVYGDVVLRALGSEEPDAAPIKLLVGSKESSLEISHEEMRVDLLLFPTTRKLTDREASTHAGELRDQIGALESKSPVQRAMVLSRLSHPVEPHIFLRGSAASPGAAVPRRFLQVLDETDNRLFQDDGRLEVAQAIASDKNPLTARVIVNRVWQHHFGEGIVPSLDNFGHSGGVPSNPALLDHLATWFMQHGWSLKALHRYILLSATWQQTSHITADGLAKDPSNELLWRMNSRRLEYEPLRDALLVASGKLDRRIGGQSEPVTGDSYRRAMYGFTDRFIIPALLRSYDVANPDTSISRRSEGTVPQQALFLMNNPFVRDQAVALLGRPEVSGATDPEGKIRLLFESSLARNPDATEVQWSSAYVKEASSDEEAQKRWVNLAQVLLLSNEFCFVN